MPNPTPNLIKTWEDIRNNPELWNQKFSLIEFKDKKGKVYWNKDYTFIPKWQRFKEAKDWIKNTKFLEYNCKIGSNANNEILLVSQNYFGSQRWKAEKEQELLGKIRKKLHKEINNNGDDNYYQSELKAGLKLNNYEDFYNFAHSHLFQEELQEWKKLEKQEEEPNKSYDLSRSDIALLWKKQLYFISFFTYSNNYKLTVEIRARKCLLSLNYPDWVSSPGAGVINQAPNLIKDTNEKNPIEGHRLHYDFCGELGIKKIEQQAFTTYQPKFQLFRAKVQDTAGGTRSITWSSQNSSSGDVKQLSIPTDVLLTRFREGDENGASRSWIQDAALGALIGLKSLGGFNTAAFRDLGRMLMNARIVLTIGPEEMDPGKGAYFSTFKQYEEELFPKNPTFTKWLKEQPHLWDHTTFQFYLFNKITMTANGRYLGIKEKDGKFVLPYKLFINYSPGNLYYRWEFAYIMVKCEVSTQGNFDDWTNPARIMRGMNFKIGGKFLGTGGGIGYGLNWNDVGQEAGKLEDQEDPSPEQEAQTERKFKNTFRSFNDKSVEPSLFNANTIDFHYSLGEFFNRLTDPIFFYRVEISELLYNRLNWANNKSTPLNLPLSWRELGTWTQRPGLWKWSNVYLKKDINNFFTNLMNRGYWLDDGEDLKNPKLAFAHAANHIQVGGNSWDISIAEEEIISKVEHIKEELMTANIENADYSNKDYIGSPDSNIWEELSRDTTASKHLGKSPFNNFCLGCLCGGGSHGKPNYNFSQTYHFSSGGRLYLKTRGSGEQMCEIPDQGGKVVFEAHGNTAKLTLEYDKITQEVKVGKKEKTVEQEIGETELENEVEEEQEEEFEEENENEMLDKLGREKEKEAEVEKEQENEQEQEDEQEEEQEEEKEDEKEDETEKEKEKEDEKESEKEDESEDEDEGEGEGEEEI